MNSNFPPPNRAIGWYRFMLWMMPTCIALTTAFGFEWLSGLLRIRGGFLVDLWILMNIAATIGIGVFEVKLRNSDPNLQIRTRPGVIGFFLLQFLIIPACLAGGWVISRWFFLLQFLIIPAFSIAILFAACLFGGF